MVSGYSTGGSAYLIPALQIVQDIQRQLGHPVEFPGRQHSEILPSYKQQVHDGDSVSSVLKRKTPAECTEMAPEFAFPGIKKNKRFDLSDPTPVNFNSTKFGLTDIKFGSSYAGLGSVMAANMPTGATRTSFTRTLQLPAGEDFVPFTSPLLSGPVAPSDTPKRMPIRQTLQAKGLRVPKKRSSGTVLVSPALLPRISPSIKPLFPSTTETPHSLLLNSTANYQNILEGPHIPVAYPTELSTNLTTTRTSHKIAEQGRRNRINSAMQEIYKLLPRGQASDGSTNTGDNETIPQSSHGGHESANSKASTVEQAIEYIKQLRKDLAEANKRAENAEKLSQKLLKEKT